jgi:hypothetical protein
MSDRSDEVDDRARSVTLPTDEGEDVIAQQNVGPESEDGSGEWPSPVAEPAGPAPGTTPEGAQAASRREQAPLRRPSADSASQADQQQDASTAGDRGPARRDDPPESFNEVLGADPVAGGSQSEPDEKDEVDTSPG